MQTPRIGRSRARDPFLDLVRTVAILAVVGQHWIMPVLGYDNATVTTGNALTTPGWWVFTWLSQVMPLVFFAGGAANLISLDRGCGTRTWLGARVRRLLLPVLPLLAVWLVVPEVLRELGIAEQPLHVAGAIAGQLLWFLAVYLLTVLLTPPLAAAHRRWGLAVPVTLAGAAAVVDLARFTDVPLIGYANALFVWLAVHQLGFHYASGRLACLPRRGALWLAASGFTVTALLVLTGPYPASMIGMPGAPMSNMSPPTVLLVFLAIGQIGLLLAARPALLALAARPGARKALSWLGPRFMTIYLWHMPALIVVAGVTVLGFGYTTPDPGSLSWFVATPEWVLLNGAVLLVLLRVFGRFEVRQVAVNATVNVAQLSVATLLGSTGLLGLAAKGFTTPQGAGPVGGPLPWLSLVLLAYLLTTHPVRETGVRLLSWSVATWNSVRGVRV